jgi:hypothetical protein
MGKTEKKRKNVEQYLNRRETNALWEETGRIPDSSVKDNEISFSNAVDTTATREEGERHD